MSDTTNVTFQVSRKKLARLAEKAMQRTIAAGRVVTRSELIREGIDMICSDDDEAKNG